MSGMGFWLEAERRCDRRLIFEHRQPFSIRSAQDPGLAVSGTTAKKFGTLNYKPLLISQRNAPPAELRFPRIWHVEASGLQLFANLLDLRRAQLGRLQRFLGFQMVHGREAH